MSSRKTKGKTTKKRAQRATSNVFAMFDQAQIQEFKEAFNMIDQNRDGFIDKEDLHDMLASLGKFLELFRHLLCRPERSQLPNELPSSCCYLLAPRCVHLILTEYIENGCCFSSCAYFFCQCVQVTAQGKYFLSTAFDSLCECLSTSG